MGVSFINFCFARKTVVAHMRKLLIATHGRLAEGFKSSLAILTGRQDDVEVINAYVDEVDYTPQIEDFIASTGPDDEAVIFTDIYGGSVFQKVCLLEPERRGVFHVTGANLGLVIEVLLAPEAITREYLETALREARQTMALVAPLSAQVSSATTGTSEADDDFFG